MEPTPTTPRGGITELDIAGATTRELLRQLVHYTAVIVQQQDQQLRILLDLQHKADQALAAAPLVRAAGKLGGLLGGQRPVSRTEVH
jgi:hypothetical protein